MGVWTVRENQRVDGRKWRVETAKDLRVFMIFWWSINIGRLDCAKDGSFDWFLGPVEARRASDSEMRVATTKEMEPSDAPKPPNGTF